MRILFVNQVADRSESSLVQEMIRRGHNITIIGDPCESLLHQFEILGGHSILLSIRNRLDFSAAKVIRKVCKEKAIEIIYSSFNAGISTSLLATMGLPTKVIGYRGTLGNLSRRDPSSYLTHLHPGLAGVVCNCEPIRNFLGDITKRPERLTTIFKGHSSSWYESSSLINKEALGFSEEHIVVGLVANMRPLKGIEDLLEALSPLFSQYPVRLALIGEDRGNLIKQKVEEMALGPYVSMLGFRKDAAELSKAFDIACLPSTRREGVPRSIVEAMCHSKPCVVTSVGGLPYIVKDRINGLVVLPKKPEQLRKALEELIQDKPKREQYGAASRKLFDEKFSLSEYHQKMEAFFSETLHATAH